MNCEVKYESHNAKVIERKLNVRHRLQHTHYIDSYSSYSNLFKKSIFQYMLTPLFLYQLTLRKRRGKKEGENSRFIDSYL